MSPALSANRVRVYIGSKLAARATSEGRDVLLEMHQYGLVTAGCSIVCKKMQLVYDHHATWAHATLDVCNAYPTLGRLPSADTLLHILEQYRLPVVFDTLCYFLIMYAEPGTGYFLAMQKLIVTLITDGIDQGCPIGNWLYGLVVSYRVTTALRRLFKPVAIAFIVDDQTLAAPIWHPTTGRLHHPAAWYLPHTF